MRTHPLNVSYLVVGLVYLGIAGSWGLRRLGVVDLASVAWILPSTLVVSGLAGLVALGARGVRRRDQPEQPGRDGASSGSGAG